MFEFLDIDYQDKLGKDIFAEEALMYLKVKDHMLRDSYETEQFYVNFIAEAGSIEQKKRLSELMLVKEESQKKITPHSLKKDFWIAEKYSVKDEDTKRISLCRELGIRYIPSRISWKFNIPLDILEKEDLINFPDELHSPNYRKYKEYIQAAPH